VHVRRETNSVEIVITCVYTIAYKRNRSHRTHSSKFTTATSSLPVKVRYKVVHILTESRYALHKVQGELARPSLNEQLHDGHACT
jgi:hypothetical protein